MMKSLLRTLAFLPASVILFGCVDDSYDLSNADTTTRVNINDLVLPVNIDPVKLGDVIDIDQDSKIQSVNIGGNEFYALVESGKFESKPINIDGVSAAAQPINPTRETLRRLIGDTDSRHRAPMGEFIYPIVEVGNYFSYDAIDIDDAIVSLGYIETAPFEFRLNLEIEDPHTTISSMAFTDLVIRSPKGLTATPSTGTYDSATGIWRIPRVDAVNNHASIALLATGIDTKVAGVTIRSDRSLDFNSEFHIESGYVDIEPISTSFRDEVTFIITYDLSDFEVKSFSGEIRYTLEGLDIAPVRLTDIPDFLKGEETSISIANPQIYLQINNPVAGVPLDCSTGLRLTTLRDGLSPLTYTLDSPVEIGHSLGEAGPYNFVLSPSADDLQIPDGFADGLKWQKFSTLGSLLTTPSDWSVKGLPDEIEIDLVDAGVPTQKVNGFTLPHTLPAAEGRYELMAPLALNDGSHIIYSEVRDGWNDDEVDAITITRLELTAHAVNNCPVSIQLTAYALDKDGNQIDAKVESNTLAANAETDLVIALTGEVHHLDGIRFVAVLESGSTGEVLSPEQTLSLENIRAKITGYYEKEF
jgi:hypothetical protein